MASADAERVTLKAGEEITIDVAGKVVIALIDGVAHVAGVALNPGVEMPYKLSGDGVRTVSVYTLEGCNLQITAPTTNAWSKSATQAHHAVTAAKKVLAAVPVSTTLCLGAEGAGKTHCAAALCNTLAARSDTTVVYLDLDISSNNTCAGSISGRIVTSEDPVYPGYSTTRSTPVVFYVGSARLSTANLTAFYHQLEQLISCAQWLVACRETLSRHIVVDCPRPPAGVEASTFFAQLAQICTPTHAALVADKGSMAEVQDAVTRKVPQVAFLTLPKLASSKPRASSSSELAASLSIEEYFLGTVNEPLGCATLVAKLSEMRLVRVVANGEQSKVEPLANPAADIAPGSICAVSHAAIVQEVPFANAAGLVLVRSVDPANDEVVLVAPTGDESIPRNYFVVPVDETLRFQGDSIDVASV